MIANGSNSQIVSNTQAIDMTMDLNEHTFKMLTSDIYTDLILAPIREWSTNAIDACLEAELPVKFNVHLPTITEPFFSVRDYGTGLSNEDVEGLFSAVGASTKRKSNKYNGVFGIGRLAGLAYTKDSFTVISYFDGTKSTYLVTTSEGLPKTVPLGSTSTTEPNGLELSLQVQAKDFQTFDDKAAFLYRFFDHLPTLNKDLGIDNKKDQATLKGYDWYIEPNVGGALNQPFVIMGNVAYQIPKHKLDANFMALLSTPLRLFVPIGALSITPGREVLSLNDETKAVLEKHLDLVLKEINSSLLSNLSNIKSIWKKAVTFNNTVMTLPYQIRKLIQPYKQNIIESRYFDFRGYTTAACLKPTFSYPSLTFKLLSPHRSTAASLDKHLDSKNVLVQTVKFMICDTRYNHIHSAQIYRQQFKNNIPNVILIKPEKFDKDHVQQFVNTAKTFLHQLGYDEVALASSYQSKLPLNSKKVVDLDFTPLGFSTDYTKKRNYLNIYKNPITLDDKKQYWYTKCQGTTPVKDQEELQMMLRAVQLIPKDVAIPTIIGVPKKAYSSVEEMSNCTELTLDVVAPYLKNVKVYYKLPAGRLYDLIVHRLSKNLNHLKHFKDADYPEELVSYLTVLAEYYNKTREQHTSVYTDDITAHFNLETIKPDTNYSLDQLNVDYPMFLTYFDVNYYSSICLKDTIKQTKRYVDLEHQRILNEQ